MGGARPKANILDNSGNLWIAKFQSKNDVVDKAAWEYLAYTLAVSAGIEMAESKIEKVTGKYHITGKQMDDILEQVLSGVSQWQKVARRIRIPYNEIELMQGAFNSRKAQTRFSKIPKR